MPSWILDKEVPVSGNCVFEVEDAFSCSWWIYINLCFGWNAVFLIAFVNKNVIMIRFSTEWES